MDFKKFAQVYYNLVLILQVVLAQLSDLISEDVNTPKAIKVAELNPVIKFKLGPFESLDGHSYNSDYDMKSVKYNNRKVRERIVGLKNGKQPEQRKTGHQDVFKWENFKRNTDFEKQRRQLDWNQSNPTPINLINKSSELFEILVLINEIHNQIGKLRVLSKFLANLRAELQETEKTLVPETIENLLKFFAKNFLGDKTGNKIKIAERNRFKKINNQKYNTQYQIENLFIFNKLSGENNSKLKETDVGICNELTICKMKELLEKAVSNLNGNKISQGDIFSVMQASLQKNQVNFLKQLQRNFLKMFHSQNVTLKHINQMSKIVDFVERYHGTVNDLKTVPAQVSEERKNGIAERNNERSGTLQQLSGKRKAERKVLDDDVSNIFGSGGINETTAVRRKGCVT